MSKIVSYGSSNEGYSARWWGTHKKNIGDWKKCRRLMWVRFGQVETKLIDKYDGHLETTYISV